MTSIRRTVPFTTSAAAIWLVACLASSAPAQDDPKKIPEDPEVEKLCDVLDDVRKDRKFELDGQGRDAIDLLMQKQEKGLNPKDEKAIVKALDGILNKAAKDRPPERMQIYIVVAEALGRHGPEGAKSLQKAYDGKRFPDKSEWVPLRERLLINIGRTKDEKMVKFLLDEARRNPEAALQAKAGEALGFFEESEEKVRKEIVEDLLVKFGSLSEMASQIGTNVEAQNARDRLAAVRGPWNATLVKLTGQNFDTFREWQTWHNKNRNESWK